MTIKHGAIITDTHGNTHYSVQSTHLDWSDGFIDRDGIIKNYNMEIVFTIADKELNKSLESNKGMMKDFQRMLLEMHKQFVAMKEHFIYVQVVMDDKNPQVLCSIIKRNSGEHGYEISGDNRKVWKYVHTPIHRDIVEQLPKNVQEELNASQSEENKWDLNNK